MIHLLLLKEFRQEKKNNHKQCYHNILKPGMKNSQYNQYSSNYTK